MPRGRKSGGKKFIYLTHKDQMKIPFFDVLKPFFNNKNIYDMQRVQL
jgi:hypothetical protein